MCIVHDALPCHLPAHRGAATLPCSSSIYSARACCVLQVPSFGPPNDRCAGAGSNDSPIRQILAQKLGICQPTSQCSCVTVQVLEARWIQRQARQREIHDVMELPGPDLSSMLRAARCAPVHTPAQGAFESPIAWRCVRRGALCNVEVL
jgi:hypothetical protein